MEKTKRKSRWFLKTLLVLALLIVAAGLWRSGAVRRQLYIWAGTPESLVALYERNPETEDFVKGWADYEGLRPIDLSGEVERGTIPHFLQWDKRWGYETYGSDFLAVTGCGPTCLAMVYCGLTGNTDQNPYSLAKRSEERGWYVPGSGTAWALMTEGAEELGLQARQLAVTEGEITDSLRYGRVLICSMTPGDFTSEGHFIVLSGIDGEGRITVRDPNSRVRSERLWDARTLLRQMAAAWEYTL